MVVGQSVQDKWVFPPSTPLAGLGLVWAETVVRRNRRERAVEGSCCQYGPISCLAPESLNLGCLIPLEAALLKQAL